MFTFVKMCRTLLQFIRMNYWMYIVITAECSPLLICVTMFWNIFSRSSCSEQSGYLLQNYEKYYYVLQCACIWYTFLVCAISWLVSKCLAMLQYVYTCIQLSIIWYADSHIVVWLHSLWSVYYLYYILQYCLWIINGWTRNNYICYFYYIHARAVVLFTASNYRIVEHLASILSLTEIPSSSILLRRLVLANVRILAFLGFFSGLLSSSCYCKNKMCKQRNEIA